MEQATNLLTYKSESPTVRLLTYWTETALTTAAAICVFKRLRPCLGVTMLLSGLSASYIFVMRAKFDKLRDFPTMVKVSKRCWTMLGPIFGLQLAANVWGFRQCWNRPFSLPVKVLIGIPFALSTYEAVCLKGISESKILGSEHFKIFKGI